MSEPHTQPHGARPQRVALLTAPGSYRAEAFLEAAGRLGVEATVVEDTPQGAPVRPDCALPIDFRDHAAATRALAELHAARPLAALLAVDDSGSLLAARASEALGLPHNAPEAAVAARNKYVMRSMLARGGVPIPQFRLCATSEDLPALAAQVAYPCVVKPLELNGSRGVIRADTPAEFVAAARRLIALLRSIYPERGEAQRAAPAPDPASTTASVGARCDPAAPAPASTTSPVGAQRAAPAPDPASHFLVEEFIPGFEVALEGILDGGRLRALALFDKPDPLDGPFFEETIYVTPSRLPAETQEAILACASASAAALGLREGPVHAELRVNERGPWMIELAGRSIGGLCSKTLRFGSDATLEELILRQACGLAIDPSSRDDSAGGVMMIPIPQAGVLRRVDGLAEAEAVPGIESIEITAPLNYPIAQLPEGESYLGFIFARGRGPEVVEAALREAHARLRFTIAPSIALELR